MSTLTFGSLFAGVGGIDLGFERAGMTCKWQVEIDEFCRGRLEKHWPSVHRHGDIRTWPQHGSDRVDIIAAGFPCQDISYAGKGSGITGERSGLFYEAMRVVSEMGPRIVFLENVPALLSRGLGDVLGSLASLGFDAEWHSISAAAFGSYQIRERVFVLAYPNQDGRPPIIAKDSIPSFRVEKTITEWCGWKPELKRGASGRVWAVVDPLFQRMADGFSRGLDEDRLGAVGNAVVPQISEFIGRQIVESEKQL